MVNVGKYTCMDPMGNIEEDSFLKARCVNIVTYSAEKRTNVPENQWLEDVFPIEIVPV